MSENIPSKIIDLCLGFDGSIRQALLILERYHREIVLVVDGEGILLGTVTDGDIRRALIGGKVLAEPLSEVMCTSPVTGEPDEFKRYVAAIRTASAALGRSEKQLLPTEEKWRQAARKSIVSACDIPEGATLDTSMLTIKRPSDGLHPQEFVC
jgi:hypothetical protein